MTRRLVVVADLGRFKAFRLEEDRNFSNPRLELLEDWETNVNHHLREEVSDQAGRFRRGVPRGEGATAVSNGEAHNIDLERRRRALKTVARRIEQLLEEHEVEGCFFAADNQINRAIIAEMDNRTRARIQKNVPANLTHLDAPALVCHFGH